MFIESSCTISHVEYHFCLLTLQNLTKSYRNYQFNKWPIRYSTPQYYSSHREEHKQDSHSCTANLLFMCIPEFRDFVQIGHFCSSVLNGLIPPLKIYQGTSPKYAACGVMQSPEPIYRQRKTCQNKHCGMLLLSVP